MFTSWWSANCIISHLYTWNKCKAAQYIFKKCELENFTELCQATSGINEKEKFEQLHYMMTYTQQVCVYACVCVCVSSLKLA